MGDIKIEQYREFKKNYEFELKYNNNDLRSVASVINWNKHYGNVINTEYSFVHG